MNRIKIWGLILGMFGIGFLLFFLIDAVNDNYTQYMEFSYFELHNKTVYANCATLWSAAFTLGATAIVLYAQKKAAYFMALSTIIGALGFIPYFDLVEGTPAPVTSTSMIFLAIVTISLLLASTILLVIPTKPRT
jgi:hypothetical protein